jgi:hypothetical protein
MPAWSNLLQVTLTLIGIHDVNRLVAALEPLFL